MRAHANFSLAERAGNTEDCPFTKEVDAGGYEDCNIEHYAISPDRRNRATIDNCSAVHTRLAPEDPAPRHLSLKPD